MKSLFALLLPIALVVGIMLHSYRSSDYTVVAKVARMYSRDKSRNPFEPSNEYSRSVSFETVPPNISALNGKSLLEIDCDVNDEQYRSLEINKWYKVKIRYYPGWRIFSSSFRNYKLLSVDGGPFSEP